ncbi:MAG: Cu(I)/Ag(I) efflux system membrane fusion protein [Alphaproteobacteria bacterium]|jgi:Cu(I)/Ag(I) efflux system membrane fusion protein
MRSIITLSLMMFSIMTSLAFAEEQKYTCPMHPHYIAEEPGNCPICGMDLVAIAQEKAEEAGSEVKVSNEKEILYWVAPMNSSFKMDKPGKSPMGMDLVPVYAEATEATKNKQKGGRQIVSIVSETVQNMGVRVEKAEVARFGMGIRSYGLVTENVRLKQVISSRIAGWVEGLQITAVGDVVEKGDLLFKLYSPELDSAQQDFIAALTAGSKGRISSASKRLQSLGVQKKYIDNLKRSRQKSQQVPFFAETNGIVSSLMVSQGTYVKPGMQIATIQDYSSVWINVSVAEKDLQFLTKGAPAHIVFPNLGGVGHNAAIDYIYPTISTASRTGQIRLVLENQDNTLKPGAYADVVFEANVEKRLAIPSEAVLKSSEGDYVVVALGNGKFQSQKITVGVLGNGKTEVLSGIKEGDDIVVSSQFLIDSESALRESFRKLQTSQTPLSDIDISADELAMIDHFIDTALYIHESLTTKTEFTDSFIQPSLKLSKFLLPKFRGTQLQFVLENAERAILDATTSVTDSELRTALSALMKALKPWLFNGKPNYYQLKGLNVYMDHNSGLQWIQQGNEASNPYSDGHSMPQKWPNVKPVEAAGEG